VKKQAGRQNGKKKPDKTTIIAPHSPDREPSFIVGIGASAGGLEALKDFFKAVPPDCGMAFVVIQHLEPAHESRMADILAKYTGMNVAQAEDGVPVRADSVYTIPTNTYLSISDGRLRLVEPLERHGMRMAIDFFFCSLAEDKQERAICVILSGSGSDGTHGLRAVRSAGGMCMAQDPGTAQFRVMPQSAIDTGLVDYILPADRMPLALLDYVRHPRTVSESPTGTADAAESDELDSILKLLQSRTNSDYRSYKRGTVMRRVERRMGLKQVDSLADYLKLLQRDRRETVQLAKDMLIGISSFFRDPEAFEELRALAISPLVHGKGPNAPVRVWVPGCATGEEAYSVAILLLEELEAAGKGNLVQVFASDVDDDALEAVRAGMYPEAIATDISPERLERFFSRKDGYYQVGKLLREAVIVARQNLIADPPFSKMDLISCRNVLIYLQPEAQKKVFSIFSFALNIGGYVYLGKSETIADPRDLFETVSKPRRIYRLVKQNRQADDLPVFSKAGMTIGAVANLQPAPPSAAELIVLNQEAVLNHFHAGVVLVEPKGRILHFYGETEKYLGHPKGQASLNVLDLATGTLRIKLRGAIGQALRAKDRVVIPRVSVSRKGSPLANVTVTPVSGRERSEQLLAIIFENAGAAAGRRHTARPVEEDAASVERLEAELKALRDELDSTNQEHESADEELTAANEEVMSMNEELQSTNEELETSKEELQSINEELNTVNNQLNEKVAELTDVNNDLANLFGATEIATIFLDAKLRIKRFTPRATDLLNLIPSDLGRPIGHITQNFDGGTLAADAAAVIRNLATVEREVRASDGRWYTMRILPYRTLDERIDGAVVTFANVTRLIEMEASLKSAKTFAESIVETIREPLLVLDGDLRVVSANTSFYQTFRAAQKDTVGELLSEMGEGQWNIPALRKLLDNVIPAQSEFKDFQVEHEFPGVGSRIMRLNGRRIASEGPQSFLILLAIEDVTERERARAQLESLAAELEKRVEDRTAELARNISELEHIYNTVPAGLYLMDTGLRYLRINERLAAMNGKPIKEHIGRTFREVVPEIAESEEPDVRRVLDTGEAVINKEGSGFTSREGKRRAYWLTNYLPVKSSDGDIVGLSGMILDITERKRAEERARVMAELLALFARETAQLAYVKSVVALLQGAVGCRCLGIRIRNERDEIPYQASNGFSPEFLKQESRLQLGRDECVCTRVIVGRPLPCDAAAMTPGGSFFCNDTIGFSDRLTEEELTSFRGICIKSGFASVAVVPIRYQGEALGAIHLADERPGMFQEEIVGFMETIGPLIGEAAYRFNIQEKLRQSEERYRSLVVATTQIVWTTNARGEVEGDIASWREVTGQSREEIQGWGWIQALHPDDRERVIAAWSHAVETRSPYAVEYRIRRADGEYRDFSVHGVPVIGPDGALEEWVGACTDVTGQKRADAQRQEMTDALALRATQLRALATELTLVEQQERKRLAQILHDDLQNLLVGAKYCIAMLGQDRTDADFGKSIERLDSILAESIALSRSLVGELSPPLLTDRGLSAALKWLGEEMERIHGLAVRVTADGEIPADAEGVAVFLFQATRELLLNVVKHSGVKTADVRVRRMADNRVQIEVEDKGAGFQPGVSPHEKNSPTGLGLFGIQERITHMGGRLDLESAPARGTRVSLIAEIRPLGYKSGPG
jgi:PAS domain S-box-containing protein